MLVKYKDSRITQLSNGRKSQMFLATCASCDDEIGWLDGAEMQGLSAENDALLSPGLVCFDCYDRQCDLCGEVLNHQLPYTLGIHICSLCKIEMLDMVCASRSALVTGCEIALNWPRRSALVMVGQMEALVSKGAGSRGLSNVTKVAAKALLLKKPDAEAVKNLLEETEETLTRLCGKLNGYQCTRRGHTQSDSLDYKQSGLWERKEQIDRLAGVVETSKGHPNHYYCDYENRPHKSY